MNTSRTHIVATLGPACGDEATIAAMIAAGMDAARLNLFWGTHDEHAMYIERIRRTAKQHGVSVPIMADLPGPREQNEHGHHFQKDSAGTLTEADTAHLSFALSREVEYVAHSYVGSAKDIESLRELIVESGKEAKIIAKLEREEALEHLDEILAAADVVMVARGDLGASIPVETIPFVQNDILARAARTGKPAIVATEMLPSMTERAAPTRSDVTDVAYAVLGGASATMLSEETAVGKYPVEAVAMMERILLEAERHRGGTPTTRFL